ncbi:MAG: ROK family protein [Bacteroidota bacterium]
MTGKFAIGADIGGSHISCALIDLEKETIIPGSHAMLDVDNHAPASAILNAFARALSRPLALVERQNLAGIGFAMPGPFDYSRGIALFTPEVAKYEHLYKVDVATSLKEILGLGDGCALRFMNDAACFALGESWMGEAKGTGKSVAITLGTGFGSAFVRDGIPVVEGSDVPRDGCFWHIPFKGSIADDFFSSRWFIREYLDRTGETMPGVKELAGRAQSDRVSMELFKEFGTNMGGLLAPWLTLFDPGVLVIGGNIAGSYNLFGNYLEDSLKKQNLHLRIGLSGLKEDAAITGSARLLEDNFWQRVKHVLTKM